MNLVYRICWFIGYLLLHLLFGFRVKGAHLVPRRGAVILASNHISLIDPVAVAVATPREVTFIARSEPFKLPVLSWLLPRLGVIPVERGHSDLGAIKAAIQALQQGVAFGIFPEGTRSRNAKLQPFKTGAAAIALRTGATIVPVAVYGSDKAWGVGRKGPTLFKPITVVFGEPLPVATGKTGHQALEELTKGLEAAIASLLPPEYRGDSLAHEQAGRQA